MYEIVVRFAAARQRFTSSATVKKEHRLPANKFSRYVECIMCRPSSKETRRDFLRFPYLFALDSVKGTSHFSLAGDTWTCRAVKPHAAQRAGAGHGRVRLGGCMGSTLGPLELGKGAIEIVG